MTEFTLSDLERIIASRADAKSDMSYTAQLLNKGVSKCSEKFGEEAIELIVASLGASKEDIRAEAADTLYHLLVLLQANQIQLDEVLTVLEMRTRQSGLEEKAQRNE